jgi:hypothetical protein
MARVTTFPAFQETDDFPLLDHLWHGFRARAAAARFDFTQNQVVQTPDSQLGNLQTLAGWRRFSLAFLVGGIGGAVFAHELLTRTPLF